MIDDASLKQYSTRKRLQLYVLFKVIEFARDTVMKNLDFLMTSTNKLPSTFFSQWSSIQAFIKLGGTQLLLRVKSIFYFLVICSDDAWSWLDASDKSGLNYE